MKKITFFLSCMLLTLGVTNAWAAYEKATSIAVGDVVVLVNEDASKELNGFSTSNTVYGLGEAYTTAPAGLYKLTVEEGASAGTVAFKNGSTYLNWSSGNSLTASDTKTENSSWTVTFEEGNAIILNVADNARKLQWNASSPRFACYTSVQTAVQLYKEVESTGGEDPVDPEPEPEPEPEPTTTNWVATDIANISATDVVVVTMSSGSTTWALTSANGSSSAPTAVAVTVANDGLTEEPADALKWNISNTAGSLTIYPNGTTATWLYCTNTNNGVRVGTNDNKTFTIEGTYLKHTGTSRYVGVYNSQDWRCYTNTTGNTAGQTLKFYKYVEPTSGGEGEEPTIDAPTFSLAEDTYTEAQEVTLSAEEGTIYYTLDGTTPDAESIEYTAPIVLDECGTTTIKAIAISGENTSSVASATYTIKLPLNNDQDNPYTEADAIEVYDGGCYDNQDVYVMGVVKTAQFYNSNTYTITLEGGFKFYYFYEAAGEVTFTENYIVAGDTLVACGKLVKHNETYELGAGCYLVEYKPYSLPKEDISNTKETAYTVEEAIALIDDITSDLTKQVYVKGTVSEIVTEYDAEYGNITYNISSDGSTSSPQFQLYRGKSYDGEKFTSADDIKVGDKVVVYGEMKKHNSTYEMNAGNQLVALEREDTTTALDNVEATVTPVKAIVNGQLIIIKNGVQYNAQGQVIK